MKTLLLSLLFVAGLISSSSADITEVKPRLLSAFGKVSKIEAYFVEKPDSYYAQNIVNEPFFLKVVAIDGQQLAEPVVIEYLGALPLDIQMSKRYPLRAYETLRPLGAPRGWEEYPSQIDYGVSTYLIIQLLNR
ncbi:hypothetical protein [Ruficoccus sp. ZRK36]|uniref:hypothetical protein n=1 Tax=Ruficoccus sp. ZRK36 TaxID=2866311 RepID=UPI001C72D817|nr:hypothetical protein [Ruficoccus sp. ZRK36]QYY35626.1 hypothetical protein K0V07_15170 [Ruficoccus sp. ZRK36]